MKFNIDLSHLSKLVYDEKENIIFLDPKADEVWVEILRAERLIKDIKQKAKEKLAEYIEKLKVPNKKLKADHVIVTYGYIGQEYIIKDPKKAPKETYKTKVSYLVQTDVIKDWVLRNKKVPPGIAPNPKRYKGIKVRLKPGVEL